MKVKLLWAVIKCPDLKCSKHMISKYGAKRKNCPYCGRSFKVSDNFISGETTQEKARKKVKNLNKNIR
ncbi:MAG: DUF1922 domain-containing protein [Asgard group archaeon]|jgi:hypothetical protein|nr:DUF1922 domain-containing protein [Asgard group archaeon]